MGLAFRQAEAAAARDEVPIGAVLVDSATGQVLAADHNRVEELHDPTAHAEMLVIRTVATGEEGDITPSIIDDVLEDTPPSVTNEMLKRFEQWAAMSSS